MDSGFRRNDGVPGERFITYAWVHLMPGLSVYFWEELINEDFWSLARPDAFFMARNIENISSLKKREQRRK
jgi:hypothetical protein